MAPGDSVVADTPTTLLAWAVLVVGCLVVSGLVGLALWLLTKPGTYRDSDDPYTDWCE